MNYDSSKISNYYKSLPHKSYVEDGIIHLEGYLKAPVKILWILKEAHAEDKEESWDHRGFLGWSMVDAYPRWKTTFAPVVRTSYGIMNNIRSINDVKPIHQFSKAEIYEQMRSIALINVKKQVGYSSSNNKDISIEYKKHKEILLSQIEMIAPDVIVNCSRVWSLFCDLGKGQQQWHEGVGFYNDEKRIVIQAFHPQARSKKIEKKILDIMNQCRA